MIDLTVGKFVELIPQYVINIAEELQTNNFKAYLVGGSIRDILLNKVPKDFDIATDAYPDEITNIFKKSIPTGAKFGTITVVGQDEKGERFDVEVTTFRSEADYVGGRWPSKVEFAKSIKDDLSRRDFTVNAIALDLQNFDESNISIQQILVDPFDGITDLRSKVIKAVRDPVERFTEDGLRAVRGCRLVSQLDSTITEGEFVIEDNTLKGMKATTHITKRVSIERFKDEFEKILYRSPKPSKGLRLLKEVGILELFIPELLEGINVTQPEFHTDDVFDHSLLTCDVAEDSIKLAALFHDIGKPRTMTQDEKGIHFYGHDMVGAEMTRDILKRLKFPKATIDRAVNLVRWHMFYYPSADWRKENMIEQLTPGVVSPSSEDDNLLTEAPIQKVDQKCGEHGWSDAAVRRLIKNVGGEDAIDDLMKLRIADATANPKSDFNPIEIEALSERIADVRAKDMALKVSDLDITGKELMKELGIEPGKLIGNILAYLLDVVIEEPIKNKKEELLVLAKEYLEK